MVCPAFTFKTIVKKPESLAETFDLKEDKDSKQTDAAGQIVNSQSEAKITEVTDTKQITKVSQVEITVDTIVDQVTKVSECTNQVTDVSEGTD